MWNDKKNSRKKNRGIGVASMTYTGSPGAGPGWAYSGAVMRMNADGTLFLAMGAQDIGQGSNTILTQMTAEIMGVDPEEIRVTTADTDTTLPDVGSYGSRVTFCAGTAVNDAASDLKTQLLEVAADMLDADKEDLEMKDKKIFVKGSSDAAVSFKQIGIESCNNRKKALIGTGYFDADESNDTLDYSSGKNYGAPCWSFATQIAEVEVDPETGKVEVLNFVAAHDLGRAINPLLAEGQIEGAAAQGIGWCLMEDLEFEEGKIINPNFHDYKIPTISDIPRITPILVESIDPHGPFGAKGLGEPGMVPTAPAIVNAIYDAVGVRIKSLPATPEKVFKGIRAKMKS
jgi:CO/xanthine dehydrogenase Mo-binding subunit